MEGSATFQYLHHWINPIAQWDKNQLQDMMSPSHTSLGCSSYSCSAWTALSWIADIAPGPKPFSRGFVFPDNLDTLERRPGPNFAAEIAPQSELEWLNFLIRGCDPNSCIGESFLRAVSGVWFELFLAWHDERKNGVTPLQKIKGEKSRCASYILVFIQTIENIRYSKINLLIFNNQNCHLLEVWGFIRLISCLHERKSVWIR